MAASDPKDAVKPALERLTQLKRDFEKRNKLYNEIDTVIYNKKHPRVPRGFPNTTKVQSPLAPHIINTITAALSMNPYKVQFDPVSIGPSGEQNASLREHFFNAAWRRQEREKRRPVFRIFMHSLVAKGDGVLKTVERTKTAWSGYDKFSKQLSTDLENADGEYAPIAEQVKKGDYRERDRVFNARTEEKKREMPYPITTADVPPETFYYIRGEDGFTECYEEKEVPYYATLERYGKGLSSDGKVVPSNMGIAKPEWVGVMSGTKTLRMVEQWKRDPCTYILAGPGDDIKAGQGQFVRTIRHGYGDPYTKTLRGPYFQAYGITTSSREQHLMGLSVLFGFLKLFPWLDELLTIQGAAAYQYGYPRYRRAGNRDDQSGVTPHAFARDDQDKIDNEQTVEPGDILPWNVEPVNQPSSGPDLGVAIKICRDLLELCLPAIAAGAVQGDESGYLLAQATHLARLIWQPIVDNAAVCLADRTAFESWLIEKKIREDVYVWGEEARSGGLKRRKPRMMWLGLGPDDIKGVHAYVVNLSPSTPSQDVIKVRTHDEMLKLHLESQEQAVTDMGNNPEEVELSWALKTLKEQLLPDVIQQAKARVLANQQAAANRANEAEAQQNNGMGGAANGRMGGVDVIQPGQNGEPIQPTPAGQAGIQDQSAAGGISAAGNPPGTPVTPGVPATALRS